MNCNKCRHFYRKMTNSIGYNPVPFCHLHEDTRKQPDVFGTSCFEPRESMAHFEKRVFGYPVLQLDEPFRYMLLDRLRADCKYYLGAGNRMEKYLWAGSVGDQILAMQTLWRSFDQDKKPEWLSWEDLCEYAHLMKQSSRIGEKEDVEDV